MNTKSLSRLGVLALMGLLIAMMVACAPAEAPAPTSAPPPPAQPTAMPQPTAAPQPTTAPVQPTAAPQPTAVPPTTAPTSAPPAPTTAPAAQGKTYKIFWSNQQVGHPFWNIVKQGFEDAAKHYGFQLDSAGPTKMDDASQISMIEAAIASGQYTNGRLNPISKRLYPMLKMMTSRSSP